MVQHHCHGVTISIHLSLVHNSLFFKKKDTKSCAICYLEPLYGCGFFFAYIYGVESLPKVTLCAMTSGLIHCCYVERDCIAAMYRTTGNCTKGDFREASPTMRKRGMMNKRDRCMEMVRQWQ